MTCFMLELPPCRKHPTGEWVREWAGTFSSRDAAEAAGRATGGRFVVHQMSTGTERALNTPALGRVSRPGAPHPSLL